MRREDAINELVEANWESLADDTCALDQFIRDVLRNGLNGYAEHDNADLAKLYEEQFGETVTVDD